VRLVKLRNPWGNTEWTGDWNDQSDKWTDELKEKLNVQDQDDGMFYMSYKDFLPRFRQCGICMNSKEPVPRHFIATQQSHSTFFKL